MKPCILNLIVAAFLALPASAESKPAVFKQWKFSNGTLKLLSLPWNHNNQLGLHWVTPDNGGMSSYVGIEDMAKMIRVLKQFKDWNSIKSGELKIHWEKEIKVIFREKEVVFQFSNNGGFTTNWEGAIGIAKAIEDGRNKLNEELGNRPLPDAKNPE